MKEVMAVRMAYQEQEWGQIIRQRKESGLSIRTFCEENNISERRYFYLQKKIRLTLMSLFLIHFYVHSYAEFRVIIYYYYYACKQSSKVHTFSPANAHFFTAGF